MDWYMKLEEDEEEIRQRKLRLMGSYVKLEEDEKLTRKRVSGMKSFSCLLLGVLRPSPSLGESNKLTRQVPHA